MDWSATWSQGDPERLPDHLRDPVGRRHGPCPLGEGPEQGVLIHLLEGVPVNVSRGQCSSDGHNRREGRRRLGYTGDEVGGTGAILSGQNNAGPSGGPGVAVGHVGPGALVADADVGHVVGVVQPIEDFHGGRADEPEHVAHPLGLEGFDGGLATGQRGRSRSPRLAAHHRSPHRPSSIVPSRNPPVARQRTPGTSILRCRRPATTMVVRLPAPSGEFMAAEARRWGRPVRSPVGLTGLTEPGQPTCRSTPTFYRWVSVWFGGPASEPLRP